MRIGEIAIIEDDGYRRIKIYSLAGNILTHDGNWGLTHTSVGLVGEVGCFFGVVSWKPSCFVDDKNLAAVAATGIGFPSEEVYSAF